MVSGTFLYATVLKGGKADSAAELKVSRVTTRGLGVSAVLLGIAFAGIWLFSITDRSAQAAKERDAFKAQQVRAETGLGASKASGH